MQRNRHVRSQPVISLSSAGQMREKQPSQFAALISGTSLEPARWMAQSGNDIAPASNRGYPTIDGSLALSRRNVGLDRA